MMLLALTIGSLLLAVAMTGVAWRVSREEHRRARARIAVLAAEIHESPKSEVRSLSDQTSDFPLQTSDRDLFVRPRPKSATRYGTVVAAGVFVCATAGAFAVISSRPSQAVADRANSANLGSPGKAANSANRANPLELLALGHDRDGDRLTVRGVVRNPNPAGLDHVTAIVLLFRRDGAFLTSGRADVASSSLGPGAETTFVVTVPGAADVGRYRVSFRTEDRVVPHVDRRSST
jgi:hypothetical protein